MLRGFFVCLFLFCLDHGEVFLISLAWFPKEQGPVVSRSSPCSGHHCGDRDGLGPGWDISLQLEIRPSERN